MTEQSRPQPGRRAIVFGVGGLIVGAGVTEGVAQLLDDGTPTRRPAAAGEELMTEHGVLKRVLLCYRAASDAYAGGTPPPVGAIRDAAQIVTDYIEDFHEGLEEGYVFPRLAGDPRYSGLVDTLLVQHDRGRHVTATVQSLAVDGVGTDAARMAMKTALDAFVRMYEPHEAWEDTVVFPALRQLTAQRTLDELADRFAALENARFGDAALTTMLGRVTGVEQQLGIADLSAFTPPL